LQFSAPVSGIGMLAAALPANIALYAQHAAFVAASSCGLCGLHSIMHLCICVECISMLAAQATDEGL
jgi:hypothetical protein